MTGGESSAVQFGRTRIDYQIRRSPRRRTVGISVDPRLGVLIAAPTDAPLNRLDTIVHRKARWIVERMRQVTNGDGCLPPREFVSGESYLYLGRQYRLKALPAAESGDARLIGGRIHVPVQQRLTAPEKAGAVRQSLESWYRRHAKRRLPERVAQWSGRVGVRDVRVVIRDQQRRWASCDQRGTLRFNWRTIQAPMQLVDYIVVHELVHLRHKDHSKAFWALLGRVMPDYERRRDELRRIGPKLGW